MVQLKGLFKLAPSLAIKYFKNKNNKFSWDWYELWQDVHKKSFTVAKVMREDVLKDIRSALDKCSASSIIINRPEDLSLSTISLNIA